MDIKLAYGILNFAASPLKSTYLMTQMTMNHDLCTEHTAACELYALLQNPGLSNGPWTWSVSSALDYVQ